MTLHFHHIHLKTAPLLRQYYSSCNYRLCEYSLGIKLFWSHVFHSTFTEEAGCLITRNFVDGAYAFDFPVPGPQGDVDAALDLIEQHCREKGLPLVFIDVPQQELSRLVLRYPYCQVKNVRPWQDYLYHAEDLISFAGRRYSGQRNHINKFRKLYPDYRFRPLTAEDDLQEFWQEFESLFHKESKNAQIELEIARSMVHLSVARPWFCTGCIEINGKIVAIAVGERCGDTMVVHAEKALYSYEGVYPTMVTEFAQHYGGGIRYFNREDDSSDKGLRTSKLQYLPAAMGEKFTVCVETELSSLQRIPHLHSQRLTLGPLTEADRAAYQALCLDDQRNRWWGYDYRKDLHGPMTDNYFLAVAREDFHRRRAVNFAIRLDGRFIGEVVLYEPDFRGGAELGCRILSEASGSGYGAEAFSTVADWALYELGLYRLKAKCYKENEASRRMLSACMRPSGEDETFFYFEKVV